MLFVYNMYRLCDHTPYCNNYTSGCQLLYRLIVCQIITIVVTNKIYKYHAICLTFINYVHIILRIYYYAVRCSL